VEIYRYRGQCSYGVGGILIFRIIILILLYEKLNCVVYSIVYIGRFGGFCIGTIKFLEVAKMSNEIKEYLKQDLSAVKTAFYNEEIDLDTAVKQCSEVLDLDLSGQNHKQFVVNYLNGQL
jgi:hypothetical protein